MAPAMGPAVHRPQDESKLREEQEYCGVGMGVGAGAGVVAIGFVQRSQSTWELAGRDEQFGSYCV